MQVGNAARMRVMDGGELRGTAESMPRGINDHHDATDRSGLTDINPTFNWLQLAQRIPVRVRIDAGPDGTRLVADRPAR